ncbi:MAG: hypothetical protein OXE05_13205 [Chloroflexi bacterium]|nr:hypothetical protein [Chloroflexota bacterium]
MNVEQANSFSSSLAKEPEHAGLARRAVRVLQARFGLVSNNRQLISNPEFFESRTVIQSLVTNVHEVPEIPYAEPLDARMFILDVPQASPYVHVGTDEIIAVADFSALEAACSDRRCSLFGNLGLFFRFALVVLERRFNIFSFHASALYLPEQNELMLVVGGAGAGKTVFLLEGLRRGYQVFSTEMTHLEFRGSNVVFHKGSLVDNIRQGNFVHDFPEAVERLDLDLPDVKNVWAHKLAVDLAPVAPEFDEIVNPRLSLLFPKIESGRETAVVSDVAPGPKMVKLLFDNASEKIGGTGLLYDRIPIASTDAPDIAAKRLDGMNRLVHDHTALIIRAKDTLAGTHNCMEGL